VIRGIRNKASITAQTRYDMLIRYYLPAYNLFKFKNKSTVRTKTKLFFIITVELKGTQIIEGFSSRAVEE